MKDLSLDQARAQFAAILSGLEHPNLGMAAALAEECGEVAKLLLDHHAYGKPLDSQKLGGELIDVFICLCEVATRHGVDLDAALKDKMSDIALRAPQWRADLSEALRRARSVEEQMKSDSKP
ncbi:MAG TPA: hypothetical protein PKA37_01960 [Planctomycetota bacterium]|nr:hypothetical protein [Planctomycetota bacterium]